MLVAGTLNFGNRAGGFRTEPGEHIIAGAKRAGNSKGDQLGETSKIVLQQPYNIVGLGQQGKNHAYPAEATGAIQHKGNSASGNEAGTVRMTVPQIFETRIGRSGRGQPSEVAHAKRGHEAGDSCDSRPMLLAPGMTVRRLTPTECLRLMGAPDDWLDLDPPLSDSAKYRLCGNGVVVPVARWLGQRILEAIA